MMRVFIELLISKLIDVYRLYENYVWKNEGSQIEVIFMNNTICFYLYEDNELIDEFIIDFNKKEYLIYKYVSIRLFTNILGNVLIYNDGNIFYNIKHKSYLSVIANDKDILESLLYIKMKQLNEIINGDSEYLEEMYRVIPRKRYPYSLIDSIDDRIEVSKKILEVK